MSVEEVSVVTEEAGTEAAKAEQCLLDIHKLCEGLHVGRDTVIKEICLLVVIHILCEGGEICEKDDVFKTGGKIRGGCKVVLTVVGQWWNILN